jgi:hypothetical protein
MCPYGINVRVFLCVETRVVAAVSVLIVLVLHNFQMILLDSLYFIASMNVDIYIEDDKISYK